MAWSDREWVLDGAAVRISMVGFDDGSQDEKTLDDHRVLVINSALESTIDLSLAKTLDENTGISYMADTKGGAFDISAKLAHEMIQAINPSGRKNRDVVRPWVNGLDITRRPRDMWIIDFGVDMPEDEAKLYQMPYQYVKENVWPVRKDNNREVYRQKWWIHVEPRRSMREAIMPLTRYIGTVTVAKHRLFVWLNTNVLPDHRIHVFAREDDYFFGVLHSRLHEMWSLRQASRTGVGNNPTYNNTTCFETFPFPWSPGQEPTDHPAYIAISAAAKQLHEERAAWLNPTLTPRPPLRQQRGGKALERRTLTNLYNALLVFRGEPPANKELKPLAKPKIVPAAGDFAPRLDELHRTLDRAVCDAYGWDHAVLDDDEEILRRLLALNLERAGNDLEVSHE